MSSFVFECDTTSCSSWCFRCFVLVGVCVGVLVLVLVTVLVAVLL